LPKSECQSTTEKSTESSDQQNHNWLMSDGPASHSLFAGFHRFLLLQRLSGSWGARSRVDCISHFVLEQHKAVRFRPQSSSLSAQGAYVRRALILAAFVLICLGLNVPLWAQPHPKLIVVIVVDQMRADYLDRFAPYETGGLHFLATEGADFVNANYQHSPTKTCVGHAVLLSGRNPDRTGIVANE